MIENQIIRKSFSYYLVLLLFSVSFTLIFQKFQDFLLSLVLPIVDLLFLDYYFHKGVSKSEKSFVRSIFFWSLLIRVIAVFVMGKILSAYNGMPFISDKDDYNYQIAALEILNRWKISGFGFYDDIRFSSDTYSGFPNFSALLMYFFGTSYWVPRLGNAVLSSFTVVLGYIICKKYSDIESSRFVGVLFCLFPITIIFSSLQLKDTLLLFFVVLALYASIDIIENRKLIKSIVILVLSFVGISFGRPATIVPIAGGLVFMIVYNLFRKAQAHNLLKIVSLIIVFILLSYAYQYLNSFGFASIDDYFEGRSEMMRTIGIQDSDSMIRNFSISKFFGAYLYILGGFFLPPALLIKLDETINYAAWGVLQHYAFLPFLIPAIFMCFRKRKEQQIPFFLLVVYLLFLIGQANSLFTVFSPRQTMGSVFVMYLMLPMYQQSRRNWQPFILIMSLIVLATYNVVRLYTHGFL